MGHFLWRPVRFRQLETLHPGASLLGSPYLESDSFRLLRPLRVLLLREEQLAEALQGYPYASFYIASSYVELFDPRQIIIFRGARLRVPILRTARPLDINASASTVVHLISWGFFMRPCSAAAVKLVTFPDTIVPVKSKLYRICFSINFTTSSAVKSNGRSNDRPTRDTISSDLHESCTGAQPWQWSCEVHRKRTKSGSHWKL